MSKRMSIGFILGLALALVAVAGTPSSAQAQFGKRLKEALKRNAEDKAIQKATNEEGKPHQRPRRRPQACSPRLPAVDGRATGEWS